jgi:phospholipid-binding lipoprotein MlaA
MRSRAPLGALAGSFLALLLCACATTRATSPGDPLERVNRATYRFNDAVDRAVLKPVATGYRNHVPRVIRTGVGNVLSHLAFPTTIVNDLLQLKLKDTLVDIGRFAINSTLGLAGILDPASRFGIARNDEDFGQTLGRWGVPPGPYLVLPLLGPSSLRDGPSLYADWQTDLRTQLDLDTETRIALGMLTAIDRRVELLPLDASLRSAYDPYAFVRDAWRERREHEVRDGGSDEEFTPDEIREMEEEAGIDSRSGEAPAEDPNQPEASGGAEEPPSGPISSDTSLMPASAAIASGTLR